MSELDAFESRFSLAYRRYLDEAPTEVDAAAVARAAVAAHPTGQALWPRGGPWPTRTLAFLAIVALLVAVLGAAMLGGAVRLTPRDPSDLTPSGIELLSPDDGAYNGVVADTRGDLWAGDAGRLVRYTPATGVGRTWTVGDDLRFAAIADIVPAKAGGVWLIGGTSVRRFDGARFPEAVDVGSDIRAAAAAPDGSLWVATADMTLVHISGTAVTRLAIPEPKDPATLFSIAVDTDGRVLCGWWFDDGGADTGFLSRYDGADWTTFDSTTWPALAGAVQGIDPLPDGSVVVATSRGLVRSSGAGWTSLTDKTALGSSAALAPDGSLWTAGADSAGVTTVAHLQDRHWTWFGPADGLPGTGPEIIPLSTVITNDGVFVGTGSGLYRLEDDRWRLVWPSTLQATPESLSWVAAASGNEAWAWGYGEFWHVADGSWTAEQGPGGNIDDLVRSADGTLWATVFDNGGGAGEAFARRGGRWAKAAARPAAIAPTPAGTMLVAGSQGIVGSGIAVQTFAVDGATWSERSATTKTRLVTGCLTGVAAGGDGSVWLGGTDVCMWDRGTGGLARFRDGTWESVIPAGLSAGFGVMRLVATADGSVWALGYDTAATDRSGTGTPERRNWLGRFDGTNWRIFGASDGLAAISDIAAAPDGSLWASSSSGLVRFDGDARQGIVRGIALYGIDVAPDGAVWVTGDFGVARLSTSLSDR